MLFVINKDVLSLMFSHAMRSKVLVGVLLGEFGTKYNLYYADDLLVLTTRGLKDLRIERLILLLFEGMSGFETNFDKTFLYSTNMDALPDLNVAKSLNRGDGILPVTYLGIPIFGKKT